MRSCSSASTRRTLISLRLSRRIGAAASHERSSIGSRRTARTAGTFVIALELRATSRAAYAFYSALGYRETGRVPGYYQGVEEAIRMTRDLRIGCVTRAPKS